jgi:hypothetical protein
MKRESDNFQTRCIESEILIVGKMSIYSQVIGINYERMMLVFLCPVPLLPQSRPCHFETQANLPFPHPFLGS